MTCVAGAPQYLSRTFTFAAVASRALVLLKTDTHTRGRWGVCVCGGGGLLLTTVLAGRNGNQLTGLTPKKLRKAVPDGESWSPGVTRGTN